MKIFAFQAVHIEIIDLNPETHHKWTEKETPEEMLEDKEAIQVAILKKKTFIVTEAEAN